MKAKELIEMLQQNPEAEVVGISDDGWCLTGICFAEPAPAGTNALRHVQHVYDNEYTEEDGKLKIDLFILG